MTGRNIAVIGCGPVGTVTSASFASLGHNVTGVDTNEELVASLCSARPPFIEPGLEELLCEGLTSGRLRFTTSHREALAEAAYVFFCVDTPATSTGAADLSGVRRAVAQVAEATCERGEPPVFVYKSTAPIGTGETIHAILGRFFEGRSIPPVVANPEFLREGSAVHDFFHPSRIVIGSSDDAARDAVERLYRAVDAPRLLTDLRTAELIKYVSNAFLATRVSFVNEIARLCESLDTDVAPVLDGVGLDPRIGAAFFTPGIGYGGSCLPKDIAALCHTGDSTGTPMRLLSAVREVNASQCKHAVNGMRSVLGTLEGATIGVWGVTFKGGTADVRESPAYPVIALLQNEGATVRVHDPTLDGEARVPGASELCATEMQAAEGADAIAVLSDWDAFAAMPWSQVRARMAGRLIYDGRNALPREEIEAAGLIYYGVGRPPAVESTVAPIVIRAAG